MSKFSRKILLIDGYNVIHRLPELSRALDGGLANAQDRLVLGISNWRRSHPEFDGLCSAAQRLRAARDSRS